MDLAELAQSSGGTDEPCVCEDEVPCYCPHRENGKQAKVSVHRAEGMVLPLPSSVSHLPEEWQILVSREAALRVAYAHQCLDELRKNIAKKSAMYHANKDLALGKRDRLRNYADINTVEKEMREQVKRYEDATWALQKLGVMHKYPHLQVITRKDLKAVTSVYDPNARGQRNKGLSWIWTTALGGDKTSRQDYISESQSFHAVFLNCLTRSLSVPSQLDSRQILVRPLEGGGDNAQGRDGLVRSVL